jgi:S1-C subfamily serine protease
MRGDWLDLVIAALGVLAAARGYRRGLLASAAGVAGLVGGAIAGSKLAPLAGRHFSSPFTSAAVGIAITVLAAVVVSELAVAVAGRLLAMIGQGRAARTVRRVDSLAGAAGSTAAVLFVAWVLALALSELPSAPLGGEIQGSLVLHGVDSVVPPRFASQFSGLLRVAESKAFPPIFNHFGFEAVPPAAPPAPNAVPSAVVAADAASVVKIHAYEPECSTESEGSGFVIAPDHILTNAHVVAGARSVSIVQNGSGRLIESRATVVLYDPHVDIAILYVPGLGLPALSFSPSAAQPGDSAGVLGYPENGPFTVDPARVRSEQTVTGPDIYQNGQVTRQIYAIRAAVEPGNSGGPLIAPEGSVYGVVFAKATTESDTGFALTAAQVEPDAGAGAGATSPVSTQGCT